MTRAPLLLDPSKVTLQTDKALSIGALYGCAPALLIAELMEQQGQPLLVVTPTVAGAESLAADLRFFSTQMTAEVFPDPESLPYDSFNPHPDIVSRRLSLLTKLRNGEVQLLVIAAPTLFYRLPPWDYLRANSLQLDEGQQLDLAALQERLVASGYERVSQVTQHGEFAVRGSLIDLYPMGQEWPLRIDFFDTQIESLRTFDPDTQISATRINRLDMLPARDFPTHPEAIREFRSRYRQRFEGNPANSLMYTEISEGRFPGGCDSYLPLFFTATETIWDYLPEATATVLVGDVDAALNDTWTQIEERYEQYRHDIERPLLPPTELFLQLTGQQEELRQRPQLLLSRHQMPHTQSNARAGKAPRMMINSHAREPATPLVQYLQNYEGRVLIAAESPGRRETLSELLRGHGLSPEVVDDWPRFLLSSSPLCMVVAPLAAGVVLTAARISILAENELFGARPAGRRSRKVRDPEAILSDLGDLREGAAVVHLDYGVGRYRGLSHLQIDAVPVDFITLEYAGGDLLYVPVASLNLVSRYTGSAPEQAPLHRLGTDQWVKARRKAAARIRDAAAELLDLYATRAARQGRCMEVARDEYEHFAAGFPFELTEDQVSAITATLADLAASQPMDRLICGDVGFGKTEVALRATFVAVMSGAQVAVLAPTTLLAQQHFQTFADRFADWPVSIEVLSRFRTRQETQLVLQKLASGHVDIVIGTHKLLQPDVTFQKLGLVIVDEEHRFGVRQKEKLKTLRAEVDILTLTATPIPRTLNLALGELRELSLITTPPAARLSIKTFVTGWHDTLIREACQRELKRGGQVYFVHNRVQDIARQAERISALMPEARVRFAHGQMRETELEQIMLDFYHHRFHILVCTSIIESGIDIPSANTIIINRADRFGLAQLHQLRGRVGRSHHQAFAYLIAPPENELTADAAKRLDAIAAMDDLGAGFVLATHDLEIRGAGELLGEEQTGQIQQIGFSLYTELLQSAVQAIRRGETPDFEATRSGGPEINLRLPALIPDDYMPDVQMRLAHYKRIASAGTDSTLHALQVELIDRFGLLPDATRNLFRQTRLRLGAATLGITKIEASTGGILIEFGDVSPIDPIRLVRLIQTEPERYGFDSKQRFVVRAELHEEALRFSTVEELIKAWSIDSDAATKH